MALRSVLPSVNLAARFLFELCVLAALGYWGFRTGKGPVVRVGLGLGAPLLTAVVWALFGAPASALQLHGPAHVALELAVFGSGVAALYSAGRTGLAVVFGLAVVVNRIFMYVWGQ